MLEFPPRRSKSSSELPFDVPADPGQRIGGRPIEIAVTQTPAVVLENGRDVIGPVSRLVVTDFVIVDGFYVRRFPVDPEL